MANTMKNGKACGLDEIPIEVWKIDIFQEMLLKYCNNVYTQEPISKWKESCKKLFLKNGNLTTTKNYRRITHVSAKIYNLMILNRIIPVVDLILRKNQNGFRTSRSTSGQILTIRRISEGVNAKWLPDKLLFIYLSKVFDSIHRGKMKEILTSNGIPEEIVNEIMISYMGSKVQSLDNDTQFIDITVDVLQGDTLAPFLFIICLD